MPSAISPRRPFPVIAMTAVKSADAMDFFRHRQGSWSSWRVTHHLAFRRSESGESTIQMKVLDPTDERIASLCRDWDVDPTSAQGGCYVTWKATMAWDQEGENHEGETVFALVPEKDNIRKGRILRDRGYAEIVPIAGTYDLDDSDDLNLSTPYDGGAVEEKFSFDGPDIVNRLSTVKRFGGYSTATFATERRVGSAGPAVWDEEKEGKSVEELVAELMVDGPGVLIDTVDEVEESSAGGAGLMGKGRFGAGLGRAANGGAKPSSQSAFGSGFSSGAASKGNGEEDGAKSEENGTNGLSGEVMDAAEKAGIDLAKVPPSMREDFVASFYEKNK